jgi:hypothetical protein
MLSTVLHLKVLYLKTRAAVPLKSRYTFTVSCGPDPHYLHEDTGDRLASSEGGEVGQDDFCGQY